MQKINPKKVTKDELMAMLEDAERKLEEAAADYDALKSACQKHIDERNDELMEAVKAKNSLNDEVIRLNVEMQSLRNALLDLNDNKFRVEKELEDAERRANANANAADRYRDLYLKSEGRFSAARTHPFKFLWESIK